MDLRIQASGIVKKAYKDPVDGWCITVQSGRSLSTYIRIPRKPRLKPGGVVKEGDTI